MTDSTSLIKGSQQAKCDATTEIYWCVFGEPQGNILYPSQNLCPPLYSQWLFGLYKQHSEHEHTYQGHKSCWINSLKKTQNTKRLHISSLELSGTAPEQNCSSLHSNSHFQLIYPYLETLLPKPDFDMTDEGVLPLLYHLGMPPGSSRIYWPGLGHTQQLSSDFPADLPRSQHPAARAASDPAGEITMK